MFLIASSENDIVVLRCGCFCSSFCLRCRCYHFSAWQEENLPGWIIRVMSSGDQRTTTLELSAVWCGKGEQQQQNTSFLSNAKE